MHMSMEVYINQRTSCEKGAINSQKYIKLLKEDVVPFIETNYKKNWVFQEDNARPYTSKNTKKTVDDEKIIVMEWPSHSLDTVLIENVWKMLKGRIYDGKHK